jgi:hypothetical protein
MDLDATAFHESCACGRTFYFPGALKNHHRSCTRTKKRLARALDKARSSWVRRKRQRLENAEPQHTMISDNASPEVSAFTVLQNVC